MHTPENQTTFTIFILLKTLPAWLALPRQRRNDIAEAALSQATAGRQLQPRLYDAEGFSAICTDLLVFETQNLRDYYFAMETLRDSPLLHVPYFDIVSIVPSIQNGFRQYEQQLPLHEQINGPAC